VRSELTPLLDLKEVPEAAARLRAIFSSARDQPSD
jgi:hypothetical protein